MESQEALRLEVLEFLSRRRPRERWPLDLRDKILSFMLASGESCQSVSVRLGMPEGVLYSWSKTRRPDESKVLDIKQVVSVEVGPEILFSWGGFHLEYRASK